MATAGGAQFVLWQLKSNSLLPSALAQMLWTGIQQIGQLWPAFRSVKIHPPAIPQKFGCCLQFCSGGCGTGGVCAGAVEGNEATTLAFSFS